MDLNAKIVSILGKLCNFYQIQAPKFNYQKFKDLFEMLKDFNEERIIIFVK